MTKRPTEQEVQTEMEKILRQQLKRQLIQKPVVRFDIFSSFRYVNHRRPPCREEHSCSPV